MCEEKQAFFKKKKSNLTTAVDEVYQITNFNPHMRMVIEKPSYMIECLENAECLIFYANIGLVGRYSPSNPEP